MPLSGTYSIPGDYNTISDAAIALNTFGISSSVVFNVAVNHTEIAPAGISALLPGGIVFGSISGTSFTNTIVFQKSGIGTNPIVIAGENHFAGGIMDAVIKFIGSDYITFDGIDVSENPLNSNAVIASNNMTEFGYAFFKASNTDGAKNNVIRNCTIKLNTGLSNYQNTFGVYSSTITTAVNGLTLANTTSVLGSNSDNSLQSNVIEGANSGIVVIGSNTAAAMDSGWVIDGNTITDFGIGNGEANSLYQKLGTTAQGILVNQSYNFSVSNNSVTSVSGTLLTPIPIAGIVFGWSGSVVQPSGTYINVCQNNTIAITNNLNESMYGVWSRIGNATSNVTIFGNTISLINTATSVLVSKEAKGIFQHIAIGDLTISNNQVQISYLNTNHSDVIHFIQADVATTIKREIIGNTLSTPSGQTLRTNGAVTGISHQGVTSNELSINQNSISINKGNDNTASVFYGIYSASTSAAINYSITGNTILLQNDTPTSGNTIVSGIFCNDGLNTIDKTISNNIITIQTNNIGGTTHGILSGKVNQATISENQIIISNHCATINGILLTTGSVSNQLNGNIITISPVNMPGVSTNIRGINNAVGILNTNLNEITVAPSFDSAANVFVNLFGIDNVVANSSISNNTRVTLSPVFNIDAITGNMAVIRNTASNVEIAINQLVELNAVNNSGNITASGILNSGANSLIQNNVMLSLAATTQTTANIIGIESATAGAGTQILGNSNVLLSVNSATNVSARGISVVNAFVKNNSNISINAIASTTSSTYGISGTGEIENNIITVTANAQTGITGTAGILSGLNTLVKDNEITTNFVTASGNALAMGINSTNANSSIVNNTIDHTVVSNVSDASATWRGEVYGIRSYGENTTVENNKIIRVFGSMGRGTTYFEAAGVFLDRAENPIVLGNTISNVSCNGTARDRIYLSGIYVTGNSHNGLIKNNKIFNISFNCSVTGTIFIPPFFNVDIPANTNGIWVRIADNTIASDYTIVNNHISKLYHNNTSKIGGIFGLALSTKELNYKVYHNTILIGDNDTMVTSNTTSHFGGTAVGFVNRVGSGSLDLRNNILYVNIMPRFSGYVSALAAVKSHNNNITELSTNPGQSTVRPVNYHAASNNNLFYAPSVHGRRSYFYCEGDGLGTEYNRFNIDHNTTAINDPNINISPSFSGCTSKYKTLMAGSDSNSFYQNVTLVEGTDNQEGVWTPVGETFAELGAQLIDPIYDLDFNNVSRGSAIDMGAVQFNGETTQAPEIVYSPLTLSGCGLVPTSLVLENVQITDNAGIYVSGTLIPRLYYRINSGAWSSVAGTLVSGDANNGFWNFTLTGLSAGTLSYYVIAQDKLSKIGAIPGSGLVACNVNSITTHPTSPNTLTLGGAVATYALGSWSSTPDIGKAVVIDDDLVISSSLDACSVLVKVGRTVTVASEIYLTVLNEVVVETGANLIFDDKASLVQINNVANIGDIEYNRIASVKKLDYVYWSSPVFGNGGVSGFNINNLSANPTEITGPKYKWNTLQNNNNGTGGNISQGIWVNANANLMESGKGYIVRAPNSFSETTNQPYQATFSGVPFNGDLSYPIYRGDYTGVDYTGLNGQTITNLDDNFNLIGNPYPSAISAARFIFRNTPANGGNVIGGVRVWTHGNSPSTSYQDPFYGSFAYNYTSNDYIIYTLLGSTCCPALEDDFMIAAGQGFFVQMQDGIAASDFAYFNNSMRSKNYTNANFYRTSNLTEFVDFTFEKHRIWLDILDSNLSSNRTLLGYADGATFGLDDLFDATTKEIAALQIYSFAEETKTTTQARPLPFDSNDEVSIGVTIPDQGQYTIAIAGIDGLFDFTSIYLKDIFLNLVHDLKESPYHFQAEKGVMNNRFQIVYQNSNLSQPDFNVGSVTAFVKNNEIHIKSSLDEINEITLFDLTGRKIYQKKIITKETIISDLNIANQTILIQLKMSDNQLITKKIIF
ncbi:hypothetical protein M0M57_08625 [Flavobacterium azooxidireducens]|uniref:T9SS sorting signal type C domain-containing protein n=1 Tax=Flavobacterium azooxidireducens TaxID=1871076 RepID=A0ABY4KA82_9FLAO|nr:hypothetical protein [Flavobacterium azooxidireducens]UPQ77697.1 hypothetical protein M0M57_08625 [Flavobacterium azooxidireducens]